jgi:hypothetical protein
MRTVGCAPAARVQGDPRPASRNEGNEAAAEAAEAEAEAGMPPIATLLTLAQQFYTAEVASREAAEAERQENQVAAGEQVAALRQVRACGCVWVCVCVLIVLGDGVCELLVSTLLVRGTRLI